MRAARAQMAVTSQPVVVKREKTASMLVPVSLKKVLKTGICSRSVRPEKSSTTNESTARSVTTVPRAFEKDTPS